MFDPTKPVQTRDGRKARIVSTTGAGLFPLIALVTSPHGYGDRDHINYYGLDGKVFAFPGEHKDDLINVPEETIEFFNVYLEDFRIVGPKETFEEAVEDSDPTDLSFTLKLTRRDGKPVAAEVLNG